MNENCESILSVCVRRESTKILVTLNATWDLRIAVTVERKQIRTIGLYAKSCESSSHESSNLEC